MQRSFFSPGLSGGYFEVNQWRPGCDDDAIAGSACVWQLAVADQTVLVHGTEINMMQ